GHDERDFEFATQFELPIVRVIAAAGERLDTPLTEAHTGDADTDTLVNSGEFDGMPVPQAKVDVTAWLALSGRAEPVTNYRLHDWTISRQRYWGTPIPIIYCDACGTVPVPEADLPVMLPKEVPFSGKGASPLAQVKDFVEVKCPKCKGAARRETDTMDTFVDSSWYFLRYCSPHEETRPVDPGNADYWM